MGIMDLKKWLSAHPLHRMPLIPDPSVLRDKPLKREGAIYIHPDDYELVKQTEALT